jgi:hypothetical protein
MAGSARALAAVLFLSLCLPVARAIPSSETSRNVWQIYSWYLMIEIEIITTLPYNTNNEYGNFEPRKK